MHAAVQHIAVIHEQILGYLKDLVPIPTVNPPGDHYEDLCLYAMERLRQMDCDMDLVHVLQTYENDLYPFGKGYPRMSGHYDIVPAGVTWTRDPFNPDEETGGLAGMGYLVQQGLIKADFGIITEPSQPPFVRIGHRGVLWVEVVTRGKTAHASMPYRGINALKKLVRVAQGLEDLERELEGKITAAPVMAEQEKHPTICIGSVVHGGIKTNVVPDECSMMLDRHLIPEETVQEALNEIRSVVEMLQRQDPEMQVEIKQHLGIEAASITADSLVSQTVAACHAQIHRRSPAIAISPGFNDTHYMIRELGILALTYGPGTTGTAHTPNEYIVIEDLAKTTQVLVQVALTLLS
jgi:succinyl-diaminopimelate desuccinylase